MKSRPSKSIVARATLAVVALAGCGTAATQPAPPDAPDGSAGDRPVATSPSALADADTPPDAARDAGRDADAAPDSSDAALDDAASADDAEASVEANACVLGQSCPPDEPCPDLVIDERLLASQLYVDTQLFAPSSCELIEGCIDQPGPRRLLHFNVGTVNQGNADLVLGAPQGSACFQWSDCHMHYHFDNFARYTLYSPARTVAARGHKQAFCVEDIDPAPSVSPTPREPAKRFDCTNQGLHVGFWDVYPVDKPCQWIDVTGVPPGEYTLAVEVNFDHVIAESSYSNNVTTVPVTIPPP